MVKRVKIGSVSRNGFTFLAWLELPATATPRPSYELAQQLAREGADVDQLVERCGLSGDEAKLILQMHSATR